MSITPAVMTLAQVHEHLPPAPMRMPQHTEPAITVRDAAHPVTAADEIRARLEAVEKRDREANKRARDHIMWLTIGLIITMAIPWLPVGPLLAPVLAGSPTILIEVQNWLHHW